MVFVSYIGISYTKSVKDGVLKVSKMVAKLVLIFLILAVI